MRSVQSIAGLIGNTPLLELRRYSQEQGLARPLIAKVESLNPTGSIKDRAALAMIEQAEAEGLLTEGSVIVEPTSGNTGIALAALATSRGYRCILTMPDTMSIERRQLIAAYGAEIVLTEGSKGMKGSITKAHELLEEIPASFMPSQFTNPVNPEIHYRTTGPEIWRDTDGTIDVLVAGVGTGGTITGIGRYLKERKPTVQLIAVEPKDSPVLTGGAPGPHKIQGIGAGFVPEILDTELYDVVTAVRNEDAFAAAKSLANSEGLLAGISSGAALWAATRTAEQAESKDKTIVVVLPDTGERYLSTALFD